MGRELRRVPLDFDHPIGQAWPGFLNPHYVKCPGCNGDGRTLAAQLVGKIIGDLMFSPSRRQNAAIAADLYTLTKGLAGRDPSVFGHDSIDRWRATKKIIEAAGLDPETWGRCHLCKGEGVHPDHADTYNSWAPTEPPTGEGYQLWQTTSEGSPVSPVFPTLDQLCAWAEDNATTFGSSKASADQWREMLTDSFVHHQDGNMVFM